MKSRLIQDDAGHWYVIKRGQEAEFQKWVDQQATCSVGGSSIDFSEMRVDGPHTVSFNEWEEA